LVLSGRLALGYIALPVVLAALTLKDGDQIMIPFTELRGLHTGIEAELLAAMRRVTPAGGLSGEVEALQNTCAALHGVLHAAAVASGTDAVALALRSGGVGSGDEVLTTAFVPPAILRGIETVGATPVFVDVDPATATLCPHTTAAAVTPRTRAIVVSHTHGHPADVPAVMELARGRGLLVIEDCSEAAGARCVGRAVGSLGDLGVLVFDEGGLILTSCDQLSARLWRLRCGPAPDHPHDNQAPPVPLLAELTETQAALLSVRLARLEAHVLVRRRLADLYGQLLGGVVTPLEHSWARHVYSRYAIRAARAERRPALQATLAAAGIETRVPTPVSGSAARLPVTARITAETLFLPMHLSLTEAEVRRIVHTIHAAVEQDAGLKQAA
jgi:dTDP-4-amino-4,6-dideoxygalactose transaminase